jgi:hypothetical protein
VSMRRLLTALIASLLVCGVLPVPALAAQPVTGSAQAVSTSEDTPLTVVLSASDDDAGDAVTAFSFPDGPTSGSLGGVTAIECAGDQPVTCTATVDYTPDPNFSGADSFSYTATDSNAETSAAQTIDVTVSGVNDAPTFTKGGNQTVDEDSGTHSVTGWIQASSAGPADELGQSISYAVTPTDSSLFSAGPGVSSDGTLTYTVAADAFGTTSVDIFASDDGTPAEDSATQSFTITVDALNDAPSFTKGPDIQVTKGDPAYDAAWATAISPGPGEADGVSFVLDALQPSLFTVQPGIDAAGHLSFTPAATAGSTSVTVKAVDDGTPSLESGSQTFTITIIDGPAAIAQIVAVDEDSVAADNPITLAGTDPESDPLTFDVVTPPGHGTLTGTAPDLEYTPNANFFGTDSFTFTASDAAMTSPAATVTLNVADVNDPVDARFDQVAVKATVTTKLDLFKANGGAADSAGAGEPTSSITITHVTKPAKGAATITDGGRFVTYDPSACATGSDTFDYTISDGEFTDTATVIVTINRPGQAGLSTKPLTDTPNTGFVAGSTMGSTVPIKVSWCGVTASSTSVRSYRVLQSTNGGSSYPTTLFSATTGTSSVRNAKVSTNYRWEARTVDRAGRTGNYRTSLVSRITRYQDSSSRITYTGSWASSTVGSPSGGTQRATSSTAATASIVVTNVRAFAIVGPRSSTRGCVMVLVDDVLVATVSERASTSAYRRVLYVRSLTAGTGVSHTIKVQSAGGGRIDLDAILTLSAG